MQFTSRDAHLPLEIQPAQKKHAQNCATIRRSCGAANTDLVADQLLSEP
jgi:hypothetical protein